MQQSVSVDLVNISLDDFCKLWKTNTNYWNASLNKEHIDRLNICDVYSASWDVINNFFYYNVERKQLEILNFEQAKSKYAEVNRLV